MTKFKAKESAENKTGRLANAWFSGRRTEWASEWAGAVTDDDE